jgi:hypothetical protein
MYFRKIHISKALLLRYNIRISPKPKTAGEGSGLGLAIVQL